MDDIELKRQRISDYIDSEEGQKEMKENLKKAQEFNEKLRRESRINPEDLRRSTTC